MHLIVLCEDFYPKTSGGAHIRWRFCQLAVERGHDVTVFTPHERDLAKSEVVNGVEIRRPLRVKPAGKPVYSPVSVITRIATSILLFAYVGWWLRDQNTDGLYSGSHLAHWVGKGLSILYDLPLVSFIGYTPSVIPNPSFTPKLLLERVNFRLFMGDTVFCQTKGVRDVIEARTESEVSVLHGILNRERIISAISETNRGRKRADLSVDDNEILLIYVGRLVPVKNPTGAIEVLSELPAEYTLAIVGDGGERKAVEEAICKHGVENRVQMCGLLPHEETLTTISAADALILPSYVESYPTVVFEALSLNSAAFVTPVGILPTIDHPQLHIGELDKISDIIAETAIDSSGGLDENTLERFSMERYTDELLSAFEK